MNKMLAAFAVLAAVAIHTEAHAQAPALPNVFDAPGAPALGNGLLSPPQLDQLVAPVALYPDAILTDILAAATYPAEVVEAHRWATQPNNAGGQGVALSDAAAGQGWDQSVQALVAFPQVLAMMDTELPWTERLGRAFMAQQGDVMNAVQRLRHQAQAAGTLKNNAQASVVNDGGIISINAPSPQDLYLPSYDADCVYGPGPGCNAGDDYVAWDDGIYLPYGYLHWGAIDWDRHAIRYDNAGAGHVQASRGHVGNLGTAGVWRHQGFGGAHFAAVSNGVVRPDHFNYAPPPLQQRYDIGINGRPIGRSGVTFAPRGSSGVRLAAPRAEVHATPAPHAGGGGGGRR